VRVSEGLERARGPMQSEVGAARGVWPEIVGGLPTEIPAGTRAGIRAAEGAARALKPPAILGEAKRLTGPGAGIAALLQSFYSLSKHCWEALGTGVGEIEHGPPVAASFARANAGLYIGCLYDSHYAASAIGKDLEEGYEKLGGEGDFGGTLAKARVSALAALYSPAGARLAPKPMQRPGE
jgi:hypothetical protein